MMNFLIAVITETYVKMSSIQRQIAYKHKAELNFEMYLVRKWVQEIKPFKVIAF